MSKRGAQPGLVSSTCEFIGVRWLCGGALALRVHQGELAEPKPSREFR